MARLMLISPMRVTTLVPPLFWAVWDWIDATLLVWILWTTTWEVAKVDGFYQQGINVKITLEGEKLKRTGCEEVVTLDSPNTEDRTPETISGTRPSSAVAVVAGVVAVLVESAGGVDVSGRGTKKMKSSPNFSNEKKKTYRLGARLSSCTAQMAWTSGCKLCKGSIRAERRTAVKFQSLEDSRKTLKRSEARLLILLPCFLRRNSDVLVCEKIKISISPY